MSVFPLQGARPRTSMPISVKPTSWWLDEALQYEKPRDDSIPLQGEIKVDVLIVGGGYTGLWTAIHLKSERPDMKVAVIEAAICGAGASGKNAGKVHGYWMSLPSLAEALGVQAAIDVALLGSKAQKALSSFAAQTPWDIWWIEGGGLKVATTQAHEAKLVNVARALIEMGFEAKGKLLSPAEVQAHCSSPPFRSGIFYPEEATVHPGRLVRALRSKALSDGIDIYENTPALDVIAGPLNIVKTPQGAVSAYQVVLATNCALIKEPEIADWVVAFSSYALVTKADQDALSRTGWTSDCSLSDSRMFLHYARKTTDGRILFGAGSGPIGYGSRVQSRRLTSDPVTVDRVRRGLRKVLPQALGMEPERAWGATIDVSSDRLPFAGTKKDTRIHYACGFSGHGVNPSYILARCLASLVLKQDNEWTRSAFCTRKVPSLPPEPIRFLGGSLIRASILACEDAEEDGRSPGFGARAISKLPQLLNLRIGVR